MATDRERIRRFYAGRHQEWSRLDSDLGSYEWATVTRRIGPHLPATPARVLDVGGGPGRYAIWLSQSGYEVTLVDLAPNLVAEAQQRASAAGAAVVATVGDATDLSSIPAQSFDAALSLGPFSHLLEADERRQAAAELRRVCRPGAPVAAMFLNRSTGLLDNLASAQMDMFTAAWEPMWERIFTDGVFVSPDQGDGSLAADNYSAWPSEVAAEMEGYGFRTQSVVGCEGPLIRFGPALEMASGDEAAWAFLWRQAFRFEDHPDFLIFSPHLLWLGHTPA